MGLARRLRGCSWVSMSEGVKGDGSSGVSHDPVFNFVGYGRPRGGKIYIEGVQVSEVGIRAAKTTGSVVLRHIDIRLRRRRHNEER